MPSRNNNVYVPTWFQITPHDTNNEAQGCRGFDVWAAGDIKWRDITGFEQTHTFAAPFPVRVTGQVERFYSTGTTITSPTTNIIGLR